MLQRGLMAWHVVSAPRTAVTAVTHCTPDEGDPEFLLHAGLPSPLANTTALRQRETWFQGSHLERGRCKVLSQGPLALKYSDQGRSF